MSETRRLSMALVLENLRRRGFQPGTVIDVAPFDFADPLYRESDDALWQADFVFVHKDSFLRRHKGYP